MSIFQSYKSYAFLPLFLAFFSGITYACNKASDVSRITVAGGSITEIIYALGEEEKLIAVDITSNFPKEATELPLYWLCKSFICRRSSLFISVTYFGRK